jgi:hypothetical protein
LVPDDQLELTYALIGIALACLPLGIAAICRKRAWALLTWVGAMALLWAVLSAKGTTWTDAKLILLSSPLVVLIVCAGVIFFEQQAQLALTIALGCVISFGVLYSDALQYHETNLAPTERFDELAEINERFSGRGPALVTEFDEFVFYELRDIGVSAPGFAYRSASVASSNTNYGQTVDLDELESSTLEEQELIVQRRSPLASRPPSTFALALRGKFYDVWKRRVAETAILKRWGSPRAFSAQGVAPCAVVARLAQLAKGRGGRLLVAQRAPVTTLSAPDARFSSNWVPVGEQLALNGPGRLDALVPVLEQNHYSIWLEGQIARKLVVKIDGKRWGASASRRAGRETSLVLSVRRWAANVTG